jgi:hypothetical protein
MINDHNGFLLYMTRTCLAPLPPDPCDPVPTSHQTGCGVMTDATGVFADCIAALTADAISTNYDNCLLDACYSAGSSICNSIEAFVAECAVRGFQVSCTQWRLATQCGILLYVIFGPTYLYRLYKINPVMYVCLSVWAPSCVRKSQVISFKLGVEAQNLKCEVEFVCGTNRILISGFMPPS